jgi:hypothetical protein
MSADTAGRLRTRLHPLVNVLIMAMLAMICVGEGWEDMEEFGLAKAEWLGTLLDLRNGIPSADTFRRVLSAVNPKAFNACFIAWHGARCAFRVFAQIRKRHRGACGGDISESPCFFAFCGVL